jgi:hypothetical protein
MTIPNSAPANKLAVQPRCTVAVPRLLPNPAHPPIIRQYMASATDNAVTSATDAYIFENAIQKHAIRCLKAARSFPILKPVFTEVIHFPSSA